MTSNETVVMHSMIQETSSKGMEKFIYCRSGISDEKIKVKIFILRTKEILEDLPLPKSYPIYSIHQQKILSALQI